MNRFQCPKCKGNQFSTNSNEKTPCIYCGNPFVKKMPTLDVAEHGDKTPVDQPERADTSCFTDIFTVITSDEIDGRCSCWGNDFIKITPSDIDMLKNGKVLYHTDGEYGTFIILVKGEKDE